MRLILVNGDPESAAAWSPLLAALDRTDALRLSPPGFGAPIPAGFDYVRRDVRGAARRLTAEIAD